MVISLHLKQFTHVLSFFTLRFTEGGVHAQIQTGSRALSPTKNEERATVPGSTSPLLKAGVDIGRMTAGQNLRRMLLMPSPTADQDQEATDLIAALHESSSPSYRERLTSAQYGRQFDVATEGTTKVQ